MKRISSLFILIVAFVICSCHTGKSSNAEEEGTAEALKVLVLTERGGQHGGFTDAGLKWLEEQSKVLHFEFTEINNTKPINEAYLSQFKLIIQLDFPPYTWTEDAQKAFIKYIDEGLGGWIGFHHASLLGEFDGYQMWQWFSDFMGGIRYKNYIAAMANAVVRVENNSHPIMAGVPASFVIPDDEWYTYNKSPRPNVQVLANVDEATYKPDSNIKMGDHPVIWINQSKAAKNVYFQIGHSKKLYDTPEFTKMFANAIIWATGK
jgi:chitinase